MKNKHEKQQKNLIFYRSPGGQLSPDYPQNISKQKNDYADYAIEAAINNLKKRKNSKNYLQ